jgi:hypothetical protein
VNVESVVTPDRKGFLVHKDREELMELLALRERRVPLGQKERKV